LRCVAAAARGMWMTISKWPIRIELCRACSLLRACSTATKMSCFWGLWLLHFASIWMSSGLTMCEQHMSNVYSHQHCDSATPPNQCSLMSLVPSWPKDSSMAQSQPCLVNSPSCGCCTKRAYLLQVGNATGGVRTFAVSITTAAAAAAGTESASLLSVTPLRLLLPPTGSPTTALVLSVPCSTSVHAGLNPSEMPQDTRSSDSLRLVAGHANGQLRLADSQITVSSSKPQGFVSVTAGNGTAITGLTCSPTGQILTSCVGESRVEAFQLRLVPSWNAPCESEPSKDAESRNVQSVILALERVCADVPPARPVNPDGVEGVAGMDAAAELPGLVTFALVAAPSGRFAVALRRAFPPRVIQANNMTLGQLQLLRCFCIALHERAAGGVDAAPVRTGEERDTVECAVQGAAALAARSVVRGRGVSAAVLWELAALVACSAPLLQEARQVAAAGAPRGSAVLQEQAEQVGPRCSSGQRAPMHTVMRSLLTKLQVGFQAFQSSRFAWICCIGRAFLAGRWRSCERCRSVQRGSPLPFCSRAAAAGSFSFVP
jgi:hypothetical protein